MVRKPVKSAGQWIARIVVVVFLATCMTPAIAAEADETFETAQALLVTDPAAAAAMLDRMARAGDGRAQLALGILLIDGRGVPQDRALGLAFLKLGTNHPYVATQPELGHKARATLQHYELQLTGSELQKAAQLAAGITAEQDRSRLAALQARLVPYTQQQVAQSQPKIGFVDEVVRITVPPAATENQPSVIGCALDRRRVKGSCGGAPEPGARGHCTGEIRGNDTPATARPPGAYLPFPEIPRELRRPGVSIQTRLLAHVDSSGYVCSVIMSASSGHPEFDRNALSAARRWRFSPATKGGEPVEALHEFNISVVDN